MSHCKIPTGQWQQWQQELPQWRLSRFWVTLAAENGVRTVRFGNLQRPAITAEPLRRFCWFVGLQHLMQIVGYSWHLRGSLAASIRPFRILYMKAKNTITANLLLEISFLYCNF